MSGEGIIILLPPGVDPKDVVICQSDLAVANEGELMKFAQDAAKEKGRQIKTLFLVYPDGTPVRDRSLVRVWTTIPAPDSPPG